MINALRRGLRGSKLFSFNVLNRDDWVREQAMKLPAETLVLDVGAGSCPYRKFFEHCQYKAQDFTQLQPDQLRHGGYGQIDYVCDAADIPVDANTFDAVICTEMLEHVAEPVKVLDEFGRILKPGGKLFLTAPLGSGLHQEPHHYYGGYTPYWYRRFLPGAGFGDVQITANGGFFLLFSQESIRFLRMSVPTRMPESFWAKLLWAPLWLLLLPILGLVIPLISSVLDKSDRSGQFTVGYHVTAVKE